MKLNARQEMYCKEYVIDLNQTAAAVRAGYSPRTAASQASRLMSNVNIIARIQEFKDKRADELELDAYWVLKRLKDVSDRSMQAEPVMEFDRESGSMIETGEYEFDSQGANRATELIGKHIGMFEPRLQLQKEMLAAQIKKVAAETKNEETGTKSITIVDKWTDQNDS